MSLRFVFSRPCNKLKTWVRRFNDCCETHVECTHFQGTYGPQIPGSAVAIRAGLLSATPTGIFPGCGGGVLVRTIHVHPARRESGTL
jgi:hypothetical protein